MINMTDLNDFKTKASNVGLGMLGGIFWIPFLFGAPLTFIYLIKEDAEYYHSFFGWVGVIIADSFAAGIWPFYWLGRLIFGS